MTHDLIEQAARLLYPDSGCRVIDVKFFLISDISASILAQQVIACFNSLSRDEMVIKDLDSELAVTL